jgi:hypothetical protein
LYGEAPVFIFDPDDESNRPDPDFHRNALEYWPIYPQSIRALFVRSFTDGIRRPQQGRVKETEWRAALVRMRDLAGYCACQAENFYDPDYDQTSNGARLCWACQQPLRWPFCVAIGKRQVVVLNHDTKLFGHHLDPQKTFDFSEPAAEVSRHPTEPGVWGLKNLSTGKWVVASADGVLVDVLPGKSAKLAHGLKIQFGNVIGEVSY